MTRSVKWLSIAEIARMTGVSRKALHKYAKAHLRRRLKGLYRGEGRRRVWHVDSVPVFVALRNEGLRGRGRPAGRMPELERKRRSAGPLRKAFEESSRGWRVSGSGEELRGLVEQRLVDLEQRLIDLEQEEVADDDE